MFHERGWIEALVRTYGYRPLVLTSTGPGKPLVDGLIFCRVSSWITGTRLVSLPFADHCEPLLCNADEAGPFASWLRAECHLQKWKYVELRPLSWEEHSDGSLFRGRSFYFHVLDLSPSLEHIFARLHKDSIQRRIRRAERAPLSYEVGCSAQFVDDFYQLLLMTRRRHHLIPQPKSWFNNLVECMGSKIKIRVARKDGVSIAAIVTLHHGTSVVYKYGCSDERFHNFGGMPFLFWRFIQESKESGVTEIDFGRCDLDDAGLITFKDHFGTTRTCLTYFRYPQISRKEQAGRFSVFRKLVPLMPNVALSTAGRILYRHLG